MVGWDNLFIALLGTNKLHKFFILSPVNDDTWDACFPVLDLTLSVSHRGWTKESIAWNRTITRMISWPRPAIKKYLLKTFRRSQEFDENWSLFIISCSFPFAFRAFMRNANYSAAAMLKCTNLSIIICSLI